MSKHTPRFTENFVRQHQAKHGKSVSKNNGSGSGSDNEPSSSDGAKRSNEAKETLPPVIARFTHYSRRYKDSDSGFCKWFTDGIVAAGILLDDTQKQVTETRHRFVKIETWDEEKTVIELIEASR